MILTTMLGIRLSKYLIYLFNYIYKPPIAQARLLKRVKTSLCFLLPSCHARVRGI